MEIMIPNKYKNACNSLSCTHLLIFFYLSELFDFLKINTLYFSVTCVNVLQISCKPENKHP